MQTFLNILTVINTLILAWMINAIRKDMTKNDSLGEFYLNYEDITGKGGYEKNTHEKKLNKTTKLRRDKSPKVKKAGKSSPIRARKGIIKFPKAPKEEKAKAPKKKTNRTKTTK